MHYLLKIKQLPCGIIKSSFLKVFNIKIFGCCNLTIDSKGREIVTVGGHCQEFMIPNITNIGDDPMFSITGDIAMNWWYSNNGARIALSGSHLSPAGSNDENTHGLGNHLCFNRITGQPDSPNCACEISNIQNCPFPPCPTIKVIVQGRNHGIAFKSGPVYGNYAIYVSKNTVRFPTNQVLALLMKSKT